MYFPDCDLPHVVPGPQCLAYFVVYHWNNTVNECNEVLYGGCRATKNNFQTLEKCEETAKHICTSND